MKKKKMKAWVVTNVHMEYDDNWYWPHDGNITQAYLNKKKAEHAALAEEASLLLSGFRELWKLGHWSEVGDETRTEWTEALRKKGIIIDSGEIQNEDISFSQMKAFKQIIGMDFYEVTQVVIEV